MDCPHCRRPIAPGTTQGPGCRKPVGGTPPLKGSMRRRAEPADVPAGRGAGLQAPTLPRPAMTAHGSRTRTIRTRLGARCGHQADSPAVRPLGGL